MERPCIAFVSCVDEDSTSNLRNELLGTNSDISKEILEHIEASELSLKTKYYEADVWLCSLKQKTVGSESFSESVEAAVFYFDGKSLELVNPWISFLQHWDPETRILVCDKLLCADAENWCVENGFETVELNPSEESRQELDEYGETYGVERILQILKTHPWSNAVMKEGPDADNAARLRKYLQDEDKIPGCSSVTSDEAVDELASKLAEGSIACASKNVPDSSHRDHIFGQGTSDELLFKAVNEGEDPGEVSFEELFGQFESMKKRAESLPEAERKAYAEKVVMAFWKAVGGDDEEVDGLSNDSDKDFEP